MTKKELMKLSKEQLAKACRNQGKDTSGDKAALAARLAEPEVVEPEAPPPEEKEPEESGKGGEEGKEEAPPGVD